MTRTRISLIIDEGSVRDSEALIPFVEADERYTAHGVITKSAVMRIALAEGLAAMKARYGYKRPEEQDE